MVPEGLRIALNQIREAYVEGNVLVGKDLPTIYPNTNISDLYNLLEQNPEFFQNQFFPELLRRIVKVQVENLSYTNPLRYLKGGEMPLGGIAQHVMVNPAEGRQFNNDDFAGLLRRYKVDLKVAYNALNWDYQYMATYTFDNIRDAFTSWDKLYNLTDSIAQSLINGAEIDDFALTKRLMANAYAQNQVPMVEVTEPTDEESAKSLIQTLRSLYRKMQFASTEYNGWTLNGGYGRPVTTWARPEDIVVFITADTEALVDVNVLARAFNLDATRLIGRVFVVDNFDFIGQNGETIDGSNIVAFIGDRRWFQIEQQMRRFNQFFNASNESWQLFLHVREAFNSLPFANMVALVTEKPTVPVTGITFNPAEVTMTAGTSITVTPNITPASTTSEVTYTIKKGNANSTDITVEKSDNSVVLTATATASGAYTLTAAADSVTATLPITVTAATTLSDEED